jgi:hypothetical protein
MRPLRNVEIQILVCLKHPYFQDNHSLDYIPSRNYRSICGLRDLSRSFGSFRIVKQSQPPNETLNKGRHLARSLLDIPYQSRLKIPLAGTKS